jgi:hypothetical protein
MANPLLEKGHTRIANELMDCYDKKAAKPDSRGNQKSSPRMSEAQKRAIENLARRRGYQVSLGQENPISSKSYLICSETGLL